MRTHATGLAALAVLVTGCTAAPPPTASPTGPSPAGPGTSASASPSPTASSPVPTPAPYPGLSIEWLRQQTYGTEGDIRDVGELPGGQGFSRRHINYTSAGITIDGYMNVPDDPGPHPVVILAHGYMPTSTYELLTYDTPLADALAQRGYLVIHPSYRNHRGSGTGDNPFRIGYATDVLHLIPMARRLPQGNGGKVGLIGHSMGGGVALRVLAVRPDDVAAAVLYGSMNGDEAKNYEKLVQWRAERGEPSNQGDLPASPQADPDLYAKVSPGNYLTGLRVPIQIHHGGNDEQVPLQWSYDLDAQLTGLGTPHELFVYPGQLHNVAGRAQQQMVARWDEFLRAHPG